MIPDQPRSGGTKPTARAPAVPARRENCSGESRVRAGGLRSAREPGDELADTLLHEYVHLVTGDVFGHHGEAWVVEGIANYLACLVLERTKYRDAALLSAQGYLTTARRALEDGRWLALQDLGSMAKWDERLRQGSEQVTIQYAEAYSLLAYVADHFGTDKLMALVRGARSGREAASVVQEVLGIPASQFEQDVKAWLRATSP